MHWSAIQEHKGTQRYECVGERTLGWMSYREFPKEIVKIGGRAERQKQAIPNTRAREGERAIAGCLQSDMWNQEKTSVGQAN